MGAEKEQATEILKASDIHYIGGVGTKQVELMTLAAMASPAILNAFSAGKWMGENGEINKWELAEKALAHVARSFTHPTRRQLLKAGLTGAVSLTLGGPQLLINTAQKLGVFSGTIKKNVEAGLVNFVLSKVVEERVNQFAANNQNTITSLVKYRLPEEHNNLTCVELTREGEAIGDAYVTWHPNLVPVVEATASLIPGIVACTPEYLAKTLRQHYHIGAMTFAAGWVGRHAVAYCHAMHLTHPTYAKIIEFYFNPPGGRLEDGTVGNQMGEWGVWTSMIAGSFYPELSKLMIDYDLIPERGNTSRGWPGYKGEHLMYKYGPNGSWQARVVYKEEIEQTITTHGEHDYSCWRPTLLLTADNHTDFDVTQAEGQANIVPCGGVFVARDKSGRQVFGNFASDMTVRGVPSEFWQAVEQALPKFLNLEMLAFSDAGGSGGICLGSPVECPSGKIVDDTVTSFGRDTLTWPLDILGPCAKDLVRVGQVFPPWHTSAMHHVAVKTNQLNKLLAIRHLKSS